MRQIKSTVCAGFQAHNECLLTCLAYCVYSICSRNE